MWTGLGIAIALAGGGLVYQQVEQNEAACEFPDCFPDETNTGVPAGTSLSAYSGPSTITDDDTVIDSKTITTCLDIQATGVVIRNSLIDCSSFVAVEVGSDDSLTIEDSEVDCNNTEGGHGLAYWNITATRVLIHACENGLSVDGNVTVQDSYIHELSDAGSDPHSDGMQFAGSTDNVDIIHNTIFGMQGTGDTDFGTSSLIADLSNHTNWLIEHNLFAGGAYTIYCAVAPMTNWVFRNNALSMQFSEDYGAFGPFYPSCNDVPSGDFTGNIDFDTGDPLEP